MKKVFTLLAAVFIGQFAFASGTSSGNWRWRNDDGNDQGQATVPTWKAPENTSISIQASSGQVLRLRLTDYSNSSFGSGVLELRYSSSSNGTFVAVPNGAGQAFQMVPSKYASNQQSSPEQISNNPSIPSFNYFNGYGGGTIFSVNGASGSLQSYSKYELEFVFKTTSAIQAGQTYQFALYDASSNQTPGTVYGGYPTLVTTAVLPVIFSNYNVTVNANGDVDVTWTTATESNSLKYVIESSIDGINFSPIGEILSKNLPNGAYYSYDYSKGLPKGLNYVRLKAVDKDATSTYSNIKPINIANGVSKITVLPNPVMNMLNINGVESGSYVQVYNSSAQKIISVVTTGASQQQLDVRALKPGAYYVQVVTGTKVAANQLIIKQ